MAVERQVTSGRERPAATVAEECNQYSTPESVLTQVQFTIPKNPLRGAGSTLGSPYA